MASENQSILDTDQLESLRELNEPDEDDIVTELIDIFVCNSPNVLDNLKQAVSDGDRTMLKKLAHKLKGSCANLGAKKMRALCLELEEQSPHLDWTEVHNSI
ncbi:MAG: Hpt domain-containing protein, partial [Zetaproteobacteria bacterium]|nr:Hpt domain-containing protein [Zetaproteobacteria bacterium]